MPWSNFTSKFKTFQTNVQAAVEKAVPDYKVMTGEEKAPDYLSHEEPAQGVQVVQDPAEDTEVYYTEDAAFNPTALLSNPMVLVGGAAAATMLLYFLLKKKRG